MAVAEIFSALGDPTRLTLVERLAARGPMRTGDLVDGLGMSRQAATKHLELLEGAGIVRSEKRGREVFRSLETKTVAEAAHWLDLRARAWESKLEGLRKLLEEQ